MQLAKEEFCRGKVLSPTDTQSLSHLPRRNVFSYFKAEILFSSVPAWRLREGNSRGRRVLTQALILRGAGCEAIVTLTGVAPQGVEATPVLTDPGLGLTLILICGDREQEPSDIL